MQGNRSAWGRSFFAELPVDGHSRHIGIGKSALLENKVCWANRIRSNQLISGYWFFFRRQYTTIG